MSISRLRDAVLVAAVLVLGGCGSAVTSVAPTVATDGVQLIAVTYAGGEVRDGSKRYAVPVGSTVEVVVASDTGDEIHLHGYDRHAFVTAGSTATLRFVADVTGVFEVELEDAGKQLLQVEVS